MSEPGPEVKPGALFAAYTSHDMEVEEMRKMMMDKTGLGIIFYFRIGPATKTSDEGYHIPMVQLDKEMELEEYRGELPADAVTVVYLGEYTDPSTTH